MAGDDEYYDALFKLVLIGDTGVGKSSLMMRFADNAFSDQYISTIGVDYRFQTMRIGDRTVKLQIWDTAGQERFRTITSSYYRGADGIILVYDISQEDSFQNVGMWLDEVKRHADVSTKLMIIGNKNDLANRAVPYGRGKAYAEELDIPFLETSARSAANVSEAFLSLAERLMETRERLGAPTSGGTRLDQEADMGVSAKRCC